MVPIFNVLCHSWIVINLSKDSSGSLALQLVYSKFNIANVIIIIIFNISFM